MTYELTLAGEIEFDSPINRDNGYTNQRLAENTHSIMRMYKMEYGYQVEWEIPEIDEVEHINLYVFYDDGQGSVTINHELGSVMDYDGVFELPEQIKGWLDKLGIKYDADLFE